jgi:hypothetical protein
MLRYFIIFILLFISLNSFSQAKAEKIKVYWPNENQFKFGGKTKKENQITEYFSPQKSGIKKWNMIGRVVTYKNSVNNFTDSIWPYIESVFKTRSNDAIITKLEKDTSSKTYWYMFKVEGVFNKKDMRQESAIFFIKQGKYNSFEVSINYPDREFPEGFEEKWVAILKKTEIYYDY